MAGAICDAIQGNFQFTIQLRGRKRNKTRITQIFAETKNPPLAFSV
jgi:hypothetical protein